FFGRDPMPRIEKRQLPAGPWHTTDDTAMACGVVEILSREEHLSQDALATRFAERFMRDPNRGYGQGAYYLLTQIAQGASWRAAAPDLFPGGSFGNGAAMRVAAVGAYFHDDDDRVAHQAAASAEVTHSHPDGVAGAVAVALASAYATRRS